MKGDAGGDFDFDLDRLRSQTFLAQVAYYPSLGSTNDQARQLAETAPELPVLVVADRQTAGRGRGANRWWTGPGSLACSLLFDPAAHGIERRHHAMLALAAAIAVVETAAPLAPGYRIGLHWPNDVFAGGRKLAGVLVESLADGRHIVGIGVNINNSLAQAPRELAGIMTALADLSGRRHDRTEVLLSILDHLLPGLDLLSSSPELLGRRADQLCLQHGRRLCIRSGNQRASGICVGIADDGALVLDTPRGPQAHYSGVLVEEG